MDSGDRNTPGRTAREKKGGFWDTLVFIYRVTHFKLAMYEYV